MFWAVPSVGLLQLLTLGGQQHREGQGHRSCQLALLTFWVLGSTPKDRDVCHSFDTLLALSDYRGLSPNQG